MTIEFHVPGTPQPGGSKTAFVNRKTGRVQIAEACKKNPQWRKSVQVFARQAYRGTPLKGPIDLGVRFTMPRPKSHYRTGKYAGELKPGAPHWHTCPPDATKLLRALEDALTGVVWADDAQIALQDVAKVYGETPGADVRVRKIQSTAASGGREQK